MDNGRRKVPHGCLETGFPLLTEVDTAHKIGRSPIALPRFPAVWFVANGPQFVGRSLTSKRGTKIGKQTAPTKAVSATAIHPFASHRIHLPTYLHQQPYTCPQTQLSTQQTLHSSSSGSRISYNSPKSFPILINQPHFYPHHLFLELLPPLQASILPSIFSSIPLHSPHAFLLP